MAKTPTEIKSLARQHTAAAISVLAGIMHEKRCPPAARVAASTALLDRGWGKPTQPVAGDDDMPPVRGIAWLTPTESSESLTSPDANSSNSTPENSDSPASSVTEEPEKQ